MSKIHRPFEKLYVKKATGRIQDWEIYIEEHDEDDVWLCMQYGQVDGKKVEKRKQITKAKAKRSLVDEAIKQAETKYNEKVNKEGYTTNPDVDEEPLIVRPMLAHKYDPKKINMDFPCIGEPKCDGNRGIIYEKNSQIVIESRNGTPIYFFDHIRSEVKELLNQMPPTFYLDGELFTHDLTFNVINGLCNKKPSNSTSKKITEKKKQQNMKDTMHMAKVKYYVFDCFDLNNLDMKMHDRKALLKKLFNNKKFQHLVLIEGSLINNASDVKKKHDEYTNPIDKKNGGYEGIMLRNLDAPYGLNKRSRSLLKYKEFQDEEFIIIDYEKDVDGGVIWTCETNITPKSKFNVRPRGDLTFRKSLYDSAKNYIGAKLIVVYQEYTDNKHGIPRFPVGKDFRNANDLD